MGHRAPRCGTCPLRCRLRSPSFHFRFCSDAPGSPRRRRKRPPTLPHTPSSLFGRRGRPRLLVPRRRPGRTACAGVSPGRRRRRRPMAGRCGLGPRMPRRGRRTGLRVHRGGAELRRRPCVGPGDPTPRCPRSSRARRRRRPCPRLDRRRRSRRHPSRRRGTLSESRPVPAHRLDRPSPQARL